MKIFDYVRIGIFIALIVVFSSGLYINFQNQNKPLDLKFIESAPEKNTINKKIAYISGEVKNPGVYEITDDYRVIDIIELSGGLTKSADPKYINNEINLAKQIEDGEHIMIPSKQDPKVYSPDETSPSSNLISINNASKAQLEDLPGIGPALAERIINERPFNSVESLLDVSGIGESKYAQIKDLVSI